MRFGSIFAAVCAGFAAVASAVAVAEQATTNMANPITAPVSGAVLKSGQAYTVTWSPTAGDIVTLVLRKGKDPKSLDTLEVIAANLPNNGAFIWVPSERLAGAVDYAIHILSKDPDTSNYSAQFKIDSNGPGIKGTTVVPSTTRSVAASKTAMSNVPKYTGTESSASAEDLSVGTSKATGESAGVAVAASGFRSVMVAGAVGIVAGGMLML